METSRIQRFFGEYRRYGRSGESHARIERRKTTQPNRVRIELNNVDGKIRVISRLLYRFIRKRMRPDNEDVAEINEYHRKIAELKAKEISVRAEKSRLLEMIDCTKRAYSEREKKSSS